MFDTLRSHEIVDDGAGIRTLDKTSYRKAIDFTSKEQIKLTPNTEGCCLFR